MKNYALFKEEKKSKFIRNLAQYNINLAPDQKEHVEELIEELLNSTKAYCTLGAPRKSKARYKLEAHGATIMGWHPFRGVWHQLAQVVTPNGDTLYYTDGIAENIDGGIEE